MPLGTLHNWEQGIRTPQGPAWALLRVVDAEPEAALRALGKATCATAQLTINT